MPHSVIKLLEKTKTKKFDKTLLENQNTQKVVNGLSPT